LEVCHIRYIFTPWAVLFISNFPNFVPVHINIREKLPV
jgi:hypothetical protein